MTWEAQCVGRAVSLTYRVHETKRRSLKDSMYSYESLSLDRRSGGHLGGRGGE